MLTKCIGIISYFPDKEDARKNRKERFLHLIETLNEYFKLPIFIVAQNWRDEDLKLNYCNDITVYNYKSKLGITKARIVLREKLLQTDYDYYILLDDDSNIVCTQESVNHYLAEIDSHPNGWGQFKACWQRLMAISKVMYSKMNYDYIKDLNAENNEVWEDSWFFYAYRQIFGKELFVFSKQGIDENSPMSESDEFSTWCDKSKYNKPQVLRNHNALIKAFVADYRRMH